MPSLSLPFADLVFHVLAHVRGTAHLAPSLFDANYIGFAERHLGPASNRTLAEDAKALAILAPTHDSLVRIQLLAWLFESLDEAFAFVAETELASRDFHRVRDPELLARIAEAGDGADLLLMAALIEADHHARLPAYSVSAGAAPALVTRFSGVAPTLHSSEISFVRSLRLRGRVMGRAIWVGAPSKDPGPDEEHVGWQAAHEATVREITESAPDLGHGLLESNAIELLRSRVKATGDRALLEAHALWLSHFGNLVT